VATSPIGTEQQLMPTAKPDDGSWDIRCGRCQRVLAVCLSVNDALEQIKHETFGHTHHLESGHEAVDVRITMRGRVTED
jgi:hypothetical protein